MVANPRVWLEQHGYEDVGRAYETIYTKPGVPKFVVEAHRAGLDSSYYVLWQDGEWLGRYSTHESALRGIVKRVTDPEFDFS